MRPVGEKRTLLWLLRYSLGRENIAAKREVFSPGLNWRRIADLAVYHGVSHIIYDALLKRGQIEPPSFFMEFLEKEYLANSVSHLFYEEALGEIFSRFELEGLKCVVHKGLGLSALLYGRPELRPSGTDIDILIRKSDYPVARRCLESIGYELMNREYESHEITYIGEAKFSKNIGEKELVVDLHTDLIANHWGKVTGFKVEDFWEELDHVTYYDLTIPSLPLDVYLLYLCIHCSANHIFDRLIILCDLALFLQRFEENINWDYVMGCALRHGAKKVLYYPLLYSKDLLGTPLPEQLLDEIKPGFLNAVLVPERWLLLRDDKPPKRLERYMHILLLDNPLHILRSIRIFSERIINQSNIRRRTEIELH